MEGHLHMFLLLAAAVVVLPTALFFAGKPKIAYLSAVRGELKKQKQWLRRGEYNAAMVKGRQNLELILKTIGEFNGIEIDNSAAAVEAFKQANMRNNGRNGSGGRNGNSARNGRTNYRGGGYGRKGRYARNKSMTNQQFCIWLGDKGYLDRVARWELNEIRMIGNKAVHENYSSKDEAWNQYRYLEDILKILSTQDLSGGKKK